uniref:SHR-BD domain-containing protein n=1 Tax=Macrostomum lignano TaxID=282301 RepID=A0A1I8G5S7_9PLAT
KVPEKFGLLVGKNNSAKGTALVGTGSASLADLSQVQRWNGQSKLEVWPGDFGNRLTGSSDGSMFPPPVSAGSSLKVFTPDLCRSADLSYSGDDRVREIPVLRFQVAKSSMMNASANPDNAAFCTPRCLDSGVLNLTLCLPGNPPIVASAPHFHGAPTYRAAVSLQPAAPADGEPPFEFNTRLEVEPNTGLLLRAARRMQINAALEQVAGFSDTDRFSSPLLMPYAWLNESGGIGVEAAARFRGRVLQPLRLSSLISWLLAGRGPGAAHPIRLRVADRIRAARRQEQPLESMNSSDLADLYSEESKLKLRTGDDAGQLDKVEKPKTGADIEERLLKDAPALPETDI